MVEIREVMELPEGFEALRETSRAEGFRLLERLEHHYRTSGGFHGPGEGLFAAIEAGGLLGVAGVCADPYLEDPRVGRVRHLYVEPSSRRRGIGRALLAAVVSRGTPVFERLRLRTGDEAADLFYRAFGFEPANEQDATHVLDPSAFSGGSRRAAH